jgi:hypothetical protein
VKQSCFLSASRWFHDWLILQPWRWRRYASPKRWLTSNGLHGVVSQKIKLFSVYSFLPYRCSFLYFIMSFYFLFFRFCSLRSTIKWHGCLAAETCTARRVVFKSYTALFQPLPPEVQECAWLLSGYITKAAVTGLYVLVQGPTVEWEIYDELERIQEETVET